MRNAVRRGPLGRLSRQLRAAFGLTLGRADSRLVVGVTTGAYLLAFLWASGDLSVHLGTAPRVLVIDDPLGRVFTRTGPTSYGAIATVDTGVLRLLLSPLNVAIGGVVAGLVGLNAGGSYLAIRQPAACGLGAGSGLLAAVPALLSGTVCCGPVVLFALGIQATGLVLTAVSWLLPVGVLALVGSLVVVGRRVAPA